MLNVIILFVAKMFHTVPLLSMWGTVVPNQYSSVRMSHTHVVLLILTLKLNIYCLLFHDRCSSPSFPFEKYQTELLSWKSLQCSKILFWCVPPKHDFNSTFLNSFFFLRSPTSISNNDQCETSSFIQIDALIFSIFACLIRWLTPKMSKTAANSLLDSVFKVYLQLQVWLAQRK